MPDPTWRQLVALLICVLGLLALVAICAYAEIAMSV
jgi:hypothetical protein